MRILVAVVGALARFSVCRRRPRASPKPWSGNSLASTLAFSPRADANTASSARRTQARKSPSGSRLTRSAQAPFSSANLHVDKFATERVSGPINCVRHPRTASRTQTGAAAEAVDVAAEVAMLQDLNAKHYEVEAVSCEAPKRYG